MKTISQLKDQRDRISARIQRIESAQKQKHRKQRDRNRYTSGKVIEFLLEKGILEPVQWAIACEAATQGISDISVLITEAGQRNTLDSPKASLTDEQLRKWREQSTDDERSRGRSTSGSGGVSPHNSHKKPAPKP